MRQHGLTHKKLVLVPPSLLHVAPSLKVLLWEKVQQRAPYGVRFTHASLRHFWNEFMVKKNENNDPHMHTHIKNSVEARILHTQEKLLLARWCGQPHPSFILVGTQETPEWIAMNSSKRIGHRAYALRIRHLYLDFSINTLMFRGVLVFQMP